MWIERRSPVLRSLAGLVRSPFSLTLPPSIAACAADRVLKKRAAHSHLSIRTADSEVSFVTASLLESDGFSLRQRHPAADHPVHDPDRERDGDREREEDADDREREQHDDHEPEHGVPE